MPFDADLDSREEQVFNIQACHVAAAMRILSLMPWPADHFYDHPVHYFLRAVAAGKRFIQGEIEEWTRATIVAVNPPGTDNNIPTRMTPLPPTTG
jgi:hypothetical protein